LLLNYDTDEKWPGKRKFSETLEHISRGSKGKTDCNLLIGDIAFLGKRRLNFLKDDAKVLVKLCINLRLGIDYLKIGNVNELKHPEDMMFVFSAFTGEPLFEEILTDEEKAKKEPMKMDEVTKRMRTYWKKRHKKRIS